jgi:hypothetical protein
MPDPTIEPSLPWSADALIAGALVLKMRSDTDLADLFVQRGGGIVAVEARSVLTTATIKAPPLLAVCVKADEEREGRSSYGLEVATVIDLMILTNPPEDSLDNQEFLRSRIVRRIKTVVRENRGELVDEEGKCLARASTEIARINFDENALPSGLLLTVIRVTYFTDLDQATQEIVE